MSGPRKKPSLVITHTPFLDEPVLVIDTRWVLGQFGPMSKQDITVVEKLGRGAFGEVHKVQHVSGAMMARKLVHIAEPETRLQIERELSILHSCRCDYIVEFYGAFSEERSLSICMELMDMSLEELLLLSGPIAEGHISWIGVCILKGIVYLKNERNVIHRDLKPANVLVNCVGQVKLCDMGLSRTLVASEASSFVGTKPYMSPERLLGGVKYTVQSEVWSFGIVLMELAVGRYPIPAVSESDFFALRDRQRSLAVKRTASRSSAAAFSTFDYIQSILNEKIPKSLEEEWTGYPYAEGHVEVIPKMEYAVYPLRGDWSKQKMRSALKKKFEIYGRLQFIRVENKFDDFNGGKCRGALVKFYIMYFSPELLIEHYHSSE